MKDLFPLLLFCEECPHSTRRSGKRDDCPACEVKAALDFLVVWIKGEVKERKVSV